MAKQHISFKLNGQQVDALVEPRELLVHTIREQLSLTGTHIGCETSHCGVCTVDLNGDSVKACTILAVQANGGEVLTVEGLAGAKVCMRCSRPLLRSTACSADSAPRACWYAPHRFLQENPDPTEEEIRWGMSGNLCRCTGYQNIIKAVKSAAQKLQQA